MVDITEQSITPILREVGKDLLLDPPYNGHPPPCVLATILSAIVGEFAVKSLEYAQQEQQEQGEPASLDNLRYVAVGIASIGVAIIHTLDVMAQEGDIDGE